MAKSPTIPKRDKKGRFKKASGTNSPQIHRVIPAPSLKKASLLTFLSWKIAVALLIVSLFLFEAISFAQNLYKNYHEASLKQAEKADIEAQYAKWRGIVYAHPNYRDGYMELALLAYRLDRIAEAKFYVQKALTLDPNFAPARELESKIRK